MDREIRVLPGKIANLIAAGEVVQRPALVVKELMENAVDAGAANIAVVISDSGRTLIQVIDDGCGMTPDNARLCFQRHATSKIATADDLNRISTYGFRGEALPSIAAVAEVTLKTRTADEETGFEIQLADSKITSEREVACQPGCNFEVRSIFYNIPARRKFLKSDHAEMQHIIEEFCRVALTRTDISFRLTHNGKQVYNVPATKFLKQRITDIAGSDVAKQLADIRTDTSIVKISGFIGTPESARKLAQNQYFFVNGRFFRSPYLNRAVCKAYENLVPEGYTPPYFVMLDVDLSKVDVNIHPSKTEIKFEDDSMIFEILNASVREVLGKSAFVPSIDFERGDVPEIPLIRDRDKTSFVRPPKINYDPLFNPFLSGSSFDREGSSGLGGNPDFAGMPGSAGISGTAGLTDNAARGTGSEGGIELDAQLFAEGGIERKILVYKGNYIFMSTPQGMLIVNARRAKLRIVFEKYLDSLSTPHPAAQKMLLPVTLELTPETKELAEAHLKRFAELGFEAGIVADNALEITAVPDSFATDEKSVREYVDDIFSSLEGLGGDADPKSGLAEKLASAASAGQSVMNDTEAQLLVEQLLKCRQPQMTPDGRSCFTILTSDKIDSII